MTPPNIKAVAVEVGILYLGNVQVWKPLTQIGDFDKTGVLTLSFTTQRGLRSAMVERRWSRQNNDTKTPSDLAWWGEDIYYVGVLPNGDFFTTSEPDDDEKLVTFSGIDGARSGIALAPRTFPANATMHKFIGAYLPPAAWEISLAIFESEMF